MSNWAAATAPDGRTYYYNKETKATQWTKPDDFDTAETASTQAASSISSSEWSEATAPDGRKYYYNKTTRETSWQVPPDFQSQRAPGSQPVARPSGPRFVAGGGQQSGGSDWNGRDHRNDRRDDRGHGLPQKPSFEDSKNGGTPWESRQDNTGFRGPMPAKTDEPEYPTAEAAEEAFFKLLKSHNIGPDSTWEDALRGVIKEREYRAIKDPYERKLAFERYCLDVRAQEKGKEKERRERIREDFRKMLGTHEEIKHYTRWKTARPMIEREAVFKSAGEEDERRKMYDEYILELKRKHLENEVIRRKLAKRELDAMLKALISDVNTSWEDAEKLIEGNEKFVSDDIFRALHKSDILVAYQAYMRALERGINDAKQEEKRLRVRRDRQTRDAFKELLNEQSKQGNIKAGTRWQDFRSHVDKDDRYVACMSISGSSPQDLFWDMVEDEERKLRSKRNDALDVLEDKRYEMTIDTTLDQFSEVMRSHHTTENLNSEELSMIYDRLMDKIKRRAEDEKLDAERQQKAAIDQLRSAMKRVEPPIRLDDTYEQVMQQLAGHRDYDNADEEVRRSAYEKYMRRLKDREQYDRERDRARRDRDRDHDRDHRNGSRRDADRDRRRRTRTPEVDAYEADRRKAQADRERQYRKASFGLTPPARDRRDDRHERDRRHDRHDSISHYDRERREQEVERERSYLSRADPRDKGRTLDYGDEDTVGSRPGSIRKRRDSDGSVDSRRDNKRTRHDRQDRMRTPEASLDTKDDQPELQSGSEEGEIEEV